MYSLAPSRPECLCFSARNTCRESITDLNNTRIFIAYLLWQLAAANISREIEQDNLVFLSLPLLLVCYCTSRISPTAAAAVTKFAKCYYYNSCSYLSITCYSYNYQRTLQFLLSSTRLLLIPPSLGSGQNSRCNVTNAKHAKCYLLLTNLVPIAHLLDTRHRPTPLSSPCHTGGQLYYTLLHSLPTAAISSRYFQRETNQTPLFDSKYRHCLAIYTTSSISEAPLGTADKLSISVLQLINLISLNNGTIITFSQFGSAVDILIYLI